MTVGVLLQAALIRVSGFCLSSMVLRIYYNQQNET